MKCVLSYAQAIDLTGIVYLLVICGIAVWTLSSTTPPHDEGY